MEVNDYKENYGNGWISLYRSVKKHWIFENDKYFKWWVIMLFEVNHSEKKFNRYYEIHTIKKGQSVNSLRTWSELFKTTPKTVSKFFTLLEKDSMISLEKIGKGKQALSLVTIENYAQYQSQSKQDLPQGVNKEETKSKQDLPTNNNGNKENNDNKVLVESIDFNNLLNLINRLTGRSFQVINKTTRAKYLARLKDGYTKADIQRAIQNAVDTDYHKENNFKYLTPEFFSRADKLDLHSQTKPTKAVNNNPVIHSIFTDH